MLLLLIHLILPFRSHLPPEDVRYGLIKNTARSFVQIKNEELTIEYSPSTVTRPGLEKWADTSAFQLNGDLKDRILKSNPECFSDSSSVGCVLKLPRVVQKSRRTDSLLKDGYKIAISYNYQAKMALIGKTQTFGTDQSHKAKYVSSLQQDFQIINSVIKNQDFPVSEDRIEIYNQLIDLAKTSRVNQDTAALKFIHNEISTMLKMFEENKGGVESLEITSNTVTVEIQLLPDILPPGTQYQIMYCANPDYFFKRTQNYRKFPTARPPFKEKLEKYAGYRIWAVRADTQAPVSAVESLILSNTNTAFDLVIKK